jgi:predicted AlkP superfamily pyrophosphatase or phosphodiesterase
MRRFVLFLPILLLVWGPRVPAQTARSSPKLVVVLVVDQMRGDYPVRYASLLDKGLHRLTTTGAWYRQAAYPYMNTVTCVGHSTIGTGSFPYKHGMVQNVWFDRESGHQVACTNDERAIDETAKGPVSGTGDSAARMLVPTFAETMRRDLHARVVTMSMKARSAIGLAGHTGDAVLWLSPTGELETSSAYGATIPQWAAAFGQGNPISNDSEKVWERTLPVDRYQYSDDPPGEKPGAGRTALFPHPLGKAADARFFQYWEQSPYSDEYLEKLAEDAIDTLHLGAEDHPDFLGISFSAIDVVGHAFGPRSHEVQDTLVRLDATINKLIAHLDEKVGKGNYVLALSADHGAADVPEQVPGAGRVQSPTVTATIENALKTAYGDGKYVEANEGTDVYLKPGVFDRLQHDKPTLAVVVAAIMHVPGVERVITAPQVASSAVRASKDHELRAAAFSYFPGRSGDLFVIPKAGWIFGNSTTTHGTPHDYDQHVPVIFYGAGIRPGLRNEAASPADVAVTLASMVGVHLQSPDGHVLASAIQAGRERAQRTSLRSGASGEAASERRSRGVRGAKPLGS